MEDRIVYRNIISTIAGISVLALCLIVVSAVVGG
jgi:hypothetical protein